MISLCTYFGNTFTGAVHSQNFYPLASCKRLKNRSSSLSSWTPLKNRSPPFSEVRCIVAKPVKIKEYPCIPMADFSTPSRLLHSEEREIKLSTNGFDVGNGSSAFLSFGSFCSIGNNTSTGLQTSVTRVGSLSLRNVSRRSDSMQFLSEVFCTLGEYNIKTDLVSTAISNVTVTLPNHLSERLFGQIQDDLVKLDVVSSYSVLIKLRLMSTKLSKSQLSSHVYCTFAKYGICSHYDAVCVSANPGESVLTVFISETELDSALEIL